ncbi:MAG: enoyl-CoA hydratase, partial [Hyphomonadaceae bacterium]
MTDNIDLVIVETIEAAMPKGQICSIKLNRPQAINALNYEMVSAIKEALIAGLTNENLKLVIVEHSAGRGFCAGGDIAMLKQSGASDGKAAQAFFH